MPRPQAAPCVCGRKGYAKGMCRLHYEQLMRTFREKPRRHIRKNKNTQGCCEPGCARGYKARGRCGVHYQAWKRSLLPPRPPRPSFHNPLVPKVEEMALTLPAFKIARILGVTRNMVIGIIDRARMAGRLPLSARNSTSRVQIGGSRQFWARVMATPDHVPTPDRFPVRRGCCLYMKGDPKDPAATFCGKPAFILDGSWCAEHRKIVYYKPTLDLSNLAPEQIRVFAIPEAAD